MTVEVEAAVAKTPEADADELRDKGEDTKVYELTEDAHCFSVIVNSFDELSPQEKQKIVDIVEHEKPAHTKVIHYGWVAKFWQVGVRSTVGLDAKVGG